MKHQYKHNRNKQMVAWMLVLLLGLSGLLTGCGSQTRDTSSSSDSRVTSEESASREAAKQSSRPSKKKTSSHHHHSSAATSKTLPKYTGKAYVEMNGNKPSFSGKQLKQAKKSYESYGSLDRQGRCTAAMASLSSQTAPKEGEERGDISSVHPTGWRSGMGWERLHLIGWQLGAENANEENLITGSHYCNVSGMLPFENWVAEYIDAHPSAHVLYRVTPMFKGKEQIARGIKMEARSVEDSGKGVTFCVYCFNIFPDAKINYKTGVVNETGQSSASQHAGTARRKTTSSAGSHLGGKRTYVVNTNTGKFHYPSCTSARQTLAKNKKTVKTTRKALIQRGYEPCGNCEP